jgi:small subunit ribosomal protein S18
VDEDDSDIFQQAGVDEPQAGLPLDYCVFCYHGTQGLLTMENSAMLTRFVTERGAILPRRFTKCCAKHQRALAATIRRARSLNFIPVHSKLHPRARFSSLRPPQPASEEDPKGAAGSSELRTLENALDGSQLAKDQQTEQLNSLLAAIREQATPKSGST